MKLFGDSGGAKHSGKREHLIVPVASEKDRGASQAEPKPTEVTEMKVFSFASLFHAPIWRKLRVPLIVLGSVILLALVIVLVYSIWEKPPETQAEAPNVVATVRPAVPDKKPGSEEPATTPDPQTPDNAESTPEPEDLSGPQGRKPDNYTFVLLIYDQLFANTDTILVGRVDTQEGTLDLVNIPRDTLINVNWGVKKINTVMAYERNDPEKFKEYLSGLIGYPVDNYAIANLRAVEKLVDCIGGVYYNVPRYMDYDDPTQDLHIHIAKGYQLLNGENAVKVLRFRMGNENSGYANGDLGRIATQQDFLKTMIAQFLKLGNIPNLSSAIEIIQTYVKTDLEAKNMAFFAREFLTMDKENIRFHTLPGEGISIRGGSYLQVEQEEWIKIVNDYLNPFYQEITRENLDILEYINYSVGAVSTSGEVLPIDTFLDFYNYTG